MEGEMSKYFDGDKLSGYEDSPITYIFDEKDKQITELQKRLEEKEKTIQGLIKSQEFLERSCSYQMLLDTQKENILLKQQLKQQLEEKEKEIKNLVLAHFENEINKPVLTTTQMINQDKISFCIEQLEKVKEFVKENESWEIEGSDYSIVYADDVLDQIDNQINVLRNNKDGIH